MPLHQIPLCSFKYVGDIYSSGTFTYDTIGKIFKAKEKLFYKDKVIKIDKVRENKLLYKHCYSMEKKNNKYLYKENPTMIKEFEKNLKLKDRKMNKNKSMSLEDTSITEFNKNKSIELGQNEDIAINIETDKELQSKDNIAIDIGIDKNLLEFRDTLINKNNRVINMAAREDLQLDKSESIYTNKIAEKGLDKSQFMQNLRLEKNINIIKHDYRFFNRIFSKKIDIDRLRFVEKYGDKYIDKYIDNFVDRININELDTMENPDMLKRIETTNIFKPNNIINSLDRVAIKRISKDYNTKLMYKILLKNMEKYKYIDALDRINIKSIDKDKNKKYFYREELKAIDKHYNRYLDREVITSIQKDNEKYLDYMALINIYKQIEKDLLNISIIDIYKEHDSQLQGTLIKDIYKVGSNNKFIEVTKRWWWLRPTAPTDRIIVPNKDYTRMKELLENANYEYLRYNEHPIEWGKQWGIDYNIPPYAVSIEIMLDLINILMMIWHKNIQGWLCCSGKEAIQFIMELLYDWYTMETSTPNTDYIRAYRWIRWEAEKVYFLNTENGLQAIGILIANLIDYMKYHHFDLVPLWRNPKVMDIERQFNRVAQNGDIMKDLDKLKGNRHYYIETQNFEKKNIRR